MPRSEPEGEKQPCFATHHFAAPQERSVPSLLPPSLQNPQFFLMPVMGNLPKKGLKRQGGAVGGGTEHLPPRVPP